MLKEIAFGSPLYALTLAFREAQLRTPLGMALSARDVAGEERQIHAAALREGEVVAAVVLKPLDAARVKLRQMAVAPDLRGTGLGARLVRFAEDLLRERGLTEVELHARVGARGFYESLGYAARGAEFSEIGLPHVFMGRRL